jgi:hypothetical protein
MEVNGQLHVPATLLRGRNPRYHLDGGWAGPRAGMNVVAMRKIFHHCPPPGIEPWSLSPLPILYKQIKLFKFFWALTPCSAVIKHHRFGGLYYLQLQTFTPP